MAKDIFHLLYNFIEANHKQNRRGFQCLCLLSEMPDKFTRKDFKIAIKDVGITQTLWEASSILFLDFVYMFPKMFTVETITSEKYDKVISYKVYTVDKDKHRLLCNSIAKLLNQFSMKENEEMLNCIERRRTLINIILRLMLQENII